MSFSDLADPRDVLSSLTMAYNLREWTYLRTLSFVAVLLVQLELVNTAMKVFYKWGGKTKVVPVRGKVRIFIMEASLMRYNQTRKLVVDQR